MSAQQPNAWQTASRNNRNNSASRTPQNRSNTASPSQSTPPPNVWAQRAQQAAANGPAVETSSHSSLNNFNASEAKAFLNRESAPAVYKVSGTAPWGGSAVKANNMANGQPFFHHLSKQVAAFEGGG